MSEGLTDRPIRRQRRGSKGGEGRRLLQVVARRYSRGPRGFKPGLMIFVLVGWSENVEGRRGVGWRR